MIRNRTAQIVFLTVAVTLGLLGTVASTGFFNYNLRWDFYIHFTNISNYFCIGVLLCELIQTIRKTGDSYVTVCPRLKFMGMLGILLTFLVFNIMLAPARAPHLNYTVNSIVFHVLMPVIYIADWFLFYERKKTHWTYPLISVALPLIYVTFVFIHAAMWGFDSSITVGGSTTPLIYPYFFLNLETQGVDGVAMWIGILSVAFVAVGFLFFGLDHLPGKKRQAAEAAKAE